MSKFLRVMVISTLGLFPAVGHAADDFIDGVYLKSPKLCEQAKTGTVKPLIEAGQMVLSSRGFDTTQADCAFTQVTKHPKTARAWIVTGFCEEPGFTSPDVFSIIENKPGQLAVASLAEGNNAGLGSEDGGDTGADGAAPGSTDGGDTSGGDASGSAGDDTTAAGGDTSTAPGSEFAYSGISGTYFRCEGVTLP